MRGRYTPPPVHRTHGYGISNFAYEMYQYVGKPSRGHFTSYSYWAQRRWLMGSHLIHFHHVAASRAQGLADGSEMAYPSYPDDFGRRPRPASITC